MLNKYIIVVLFAAAATAATTATVYTDRGHNLRAVDGLNVQNIRFVLWKAVFFKQIFCQKRYQTILGI